MGTRRGEAAYGRACASASLARGALAAALVIATPALARADEPPIAISWSAPEGCPSLEDVRGFLEAVVPSEVRVRLEDVRSSVVLAPIEGGFRGDVRVEREGFVGERSVEGRRCDDVARSAIIVISVALTEAVNAPPVAAPDDPTEVTRQDGPVADAGDPPPLAAPPVEAEPLAAPSAGARSRVRVGIDGSIVSGVATSVLAPRVSVLVRFEGTQRVSFGARVRSVLDARVGDEPTLARVVTLGLAPDVCVLSPVNDAVRLGGCALVEVGAVLARELDRAGRDASGLVVVGVEPALEVGDRVRFRLALEGEARLVRPRYVVSGGDTVERTPALAGGARIGLSLRIR